MIVSVTRKNREVFHEWIEILEKHKYNICQKHDPFDMDSFNVLVVSYTPKSTMNIIHGFMTVLTTPDDDVVYIHDFCVSKLSTFSDELVEFILERGRQNNKQSIQVNNVLQEDKEFWVYHSFYESEENDKLVMKRPLISTKNEAFAQVIKRPTSSTFPTHDDLSYLPPLPRVNDSVLKFEEKVHNIITGTVARSTTESRWGMKIGLRNVGLFSDPIFKLYTITEIDPTNTSQTYSVFYIYLTYGSSYEEFKLFRSQTACGRIITKSLERSVLAVELRRKSGLIHKDLSYEKSALMVANRYWNEPEKMTEKGMWISLLVFSSDCSNTAVILSTTYGSLQDLPVAIDNTQPEEKIRLPYISLVGNIETISAHALKYVQDIDSDMDTDSDEASYEPDMDMKQEARLLDEIRSKYKEDEKQSSDIPASIQTGSCTLNMSLTMMVLRSLKHNMMYLENAGGIPGCKCYSTAASVNEMFSIVYKSDDLLMYPLDKTIRGDGTQFQLEKYKQYRLFNSTHCDPKSYFARTVKRSEPSDLHKHNYMFFIDKKKLTDLYRLFKKLDSLQRKHAAIKINNILESGIIKSPVKSPSVKRRKRE